MGCCWGRDGGKDLDNDTAVALQIELPAHDQQPVSGGGGANTHSGGRMITGIEVTALGMDLQGAEALEPFLSSIDRYPLSCPGALEQALREGGGKLLSLPDDNDKAELSGEPPGAEADQPVGPEETRKRSATMTELLLEELKPAKKTARGAASEIEAERTRPTWPRMPNRLVDSGGFFPASVFVGHWVDSYGNRINVDHDTAFLSVVVIRSRRRDLLMKIRPVAYGGGWQCGHSILSPSSSSPEELH